MGWVSVADQILKIGLKLFEAWDKMKSRDAVEERAKRVQKIRNRIDTNPASALNEILNSKLK